MGLAAKDEKNPAQPHIHPMKAQTSKPAKHISARLRKTMTDAEQKLWRRLRNGQLGVKFAASIHSGSLFLTSCLEQHLVVEVDGGQHAEQKAADEARTAVLQQAGFRVLRFWNNEVLNQTDDVVAEIYRQLTPSLASTPPSRGGGTC